MGGRERRPLDLDNFDAFDSVELRKLAGMCQTKTAFISKPYIKIDDVWRYEEQKFNGELVQRLVIPNSSELTTVRD